MGKLLNISEAAHVLNISADTLRRWDNNGKFKSLRHPINNYRVYSEQQLTLFRQDAVRNITVEEKDGFAIGDPYCRTQNGTLYNTDAITLLKNLPDNSVDLIFADPPYNIKKADWDSFSTQKAYVEWSMTWIEEAHRVLSERGTLYICGFSEILADLKWGAAPLFYGCKWLVWYYRNKGNLGNDWGRSHESIIHLRKTKDFIFNVDEVRIPYNEHTVKYPNRTQGENSQFSNGQKKKHEWSPNPLGAKPKDVLEIPTISNGAWEKTNHPTQKPIELLRKIILASSDANSTIVDPFGGSGTTYLVAEAYDRQWKGSELEEDYCRLIQQRISDASFIERIYSAKDGKASEDRRRKLRG